MMSSDRTTDWRSWAALLATRLELQLRTTPLAGAGLAALLLLGSVAWLGLDRPQGFGLGPGTARIVGQLAADWLAPLAALLLLLLGTPAVLDGLHRCRRDGAGHALDRRHLLRSGRLLVEVSATALLFVALALLLTVPFSWLALLGVLLPGTWQRLLLLLGGAVLLGALSSHAVLPRSSTFGRSLIRALLLQGAVVASWVWVVH